MEHYVFVSKNNGGNTERAASAGQTFAFDTMYSFPTQTSKDAFMDQVAGSGDKSVVAHGLSENFRLMGQTRPDLRGADTIDKIEMVLTNG